MWMPAKMYFPTSYGYSMMAAPKESPSVAITAFHWHVGLDFLAQRELLCHPGNRKKTLGRLCGLNPPVESNHVQAVLI